MQTTSVTSTNGLCDIFDATTLSTPRAQCIALAGAFSSFFWGNAALSTFPVTHTNPTYCKWTGVTCSGGATGSVTALCVGAARSARSFVSQCDVPGG